MKQVINVVEDEKDLNSVVCSYLRKEGYTVNGYHTYQEALEHIYDEEVDLWILDIMLGDDSGYDLIELIKQNNPNVPVVFMSARDKDFDRIIGLEKGSDDYIAKPFKVRELVLRVNNLIKRTYRASTQRLSVDGYEIDDVQRMVYFGEEEIDLTTKEFELLLMFARKPGVAFDREYILSKVWGEDYYGSDRVVDDTLRRLRKKMPELNIHTIYGFGYRLG
ncbi:MAG TPA: response regulator transcription factor [Erysipelothrix sp.]|nr:response regulator transcription factor [Erysipelothrix sp.]